MKTEFSFSSVTCAERSVYYSAVFVFVFKKKKNRILMSEHMAGLGLCVMSLRLALFKNC